jgi:hypothetical protein
MGARDGVAFSLAGLVADGFAEALLGVGLLAAAGGLGLAGVIGCDWPCAVSSTGGGGVAAAVG